MPRNDSQSDQRVLTREEVLSLPTPSAAQVTEFVAHVSWAHSWYKHLPLLAGGEFVFFLAADAGGGYPAERPRLHYGWTTTEEYRQRYGFLDYQWRSAAGTPFNRDAGPRLELPTDLAAATRITLYPFLSSDFKAPESCRWGLHDEDMARLTAGEAHPHRTEVLEWAATQGALDEAWGDLSASEQEQAAQALDAREPDRALPGSLNAYPNLAHQAEQVYWRLQRGQEARVHEVVERLLSLLAGWRTG